MLFCCGVCYFLVRENVANKEKKLRHIFIQKKELLKDYNQCSKTTNPKLETASSRPNFDDYNKILCFWHNLPPDPFGQGNARLEVEAKEAADWKAPVHLTAESSEKFWNMFSKRLGKSAILRVAQLIFKLKALCWFNLKHSNKLKINGFRFHHCCTISPHFRAHPQRHSHLGTWGTSATRRHGPKQNEFAGDAPMMMMMKKKKKKEKKKKEKKKKKTRRNIHFSSPGALGQLLFIKRTLLHPVVSPSQQGNESGFSLGADIEKCP